MNNPEIDEYGNKFWHNDKGLWHREDGPAVEWHWGRKCWYINGKRHREDGHALEHSDGDKEWWYNDECIGKSWEEFTQEDFERFLKIKEYW